MRSVIGGAVRSARIMHYSFGSTKCDPLMLPRSVRKYLKLKSFCCVANDHVFHRLDMHEDMLDHVRRIDQFADQ